MIRTYIHGVIFGLITLLLLSGFGVIDPYHIPFFLVIAASFMIVVGVPAIIILLLTRK
jgi:hypothetical protein